jgi:hypothetical protein
MLISGVPAAGKTYFAAWLERTQGYIHFDYEKEIPQLTRETFWPSWVGCLSTGDAKPFVQALRVLGSPVVWNWGFPPEVIDVVQRLKAEGFEIWWFDADHAAARKSFIARRDVPVHFLDIQMLKIVHAWPTIKALFEPNIIPVLRADGSRMQPEEIWQAMQDRASNSSA